MFSHLRWECARPAWGGRRKRAVFVTAGAAMLASALTGPPSLTAAAPAGAGAAARDAEQVDTEDVFGFVEGADIGRAGKQETEIDVASRSGKSTGTYGNAAAQVEYKYTAFDNFRVAGVATFAYYDIGGVTGLNDFGQVVVQSLSFDARFRLLDRDKAPFGLTLSVQPHWGFADETSGVPLNHFGWEALLLADRELVPKRVVGGVNFVFDTDRTRLLPNNVIEQAPTAGIGAALSAQALPGLWLGGELRYLRSYEGAALEAFSGQALYAGPTLYARIGKQGWMSAAFNVQVWGGAVGVPGALDLVNFERYQVKLRAGYEF
jgi:hypothetical protein